MRSVEVDDEVFGFLQAHGRAFVDTPNAVLRRLLLGDARQGRAKELNGEAPMIAPSSVKTQRVVRVDSQRFAEGIIRTEFGPGFRRRAPYRLMFESDGRLIYAQNFNKESDHLWYRVTENPWKELRTTRKEGWLCLTNPAEAFSYLIPIADVKDRVAKHGWIRPYLEVNIDPATSRWSELDWDLSPYRKLCVTT